MPIYEYEHDRASKRCPLRFEVVQAVGAEPIETCPDCHKKVHRVFSPTAIHGKGSSKQTLSNKNLAEKGFTKYVKAGDGRYEKAAGKGPDVIKR